MIDHLSIGVADIERSRSFYDSVFAPLGARRVRNDEPAPGRHVSGYGTDKSWFFWISNTVSVPLPEGQHIAFQASRRAAVDAFYKAALAAGGKDNGKPGLRPQYHPDYYGAFIIDPDGYRIEAVCRNPE